MNTYAYRKQENLPQSRASSIAPTQLSSLPDSQFVDRRPEAIVQQKLSNLAQNSPRVLQALQLQAIADQHSLMQSQPAERPAIEVASLQTKGGVRGNMGDVAQTKRRNKRANWNQKQIAQNERLFARRARRLEARQRAEERERIAILARMKKDQVISFNGLNGGLQQAMRTLYGHGFIQQSSSPRAVFNCVGDFDMCKLHAKNILGNLGPNRENGQDTNAQNQVKERYMVNFNGVNVIVRNFSSDDSILGTIEFQAGVKFEFKYA